jgi:hypothetical protein
LFLLMRRQKGNPWRHLMAVIDNPLLADYVRSQTIRIRVDAHLLIGVKSRSQIVAAFPTTGAMGCVVLKPKVAGQGVQ